MLTGKHRHFEYELHWKHHTAVTTKTVINETLIGVEEHDIFVETETLLCRSRRSTKPQCKAPNRPSHMGEPYQTSGFLNDHRRLVQYLV